MKTLVLLGSPRRHRNSETLAMRLVSGVRDTGGISDGDLSVFPLNELDIVPCKGCLVCQKSRKAVCPVEDDMRSIYEKFIEADLVVFATPVYWWHCTAQMTTVLNRLQALQYRDDRTLLGGKKVVAILTYTLGSPLVRSFFQEFAEWAGWDIHFIEHKVGSRPVGPGEHSFLLAYDLGSILAEGRAAG